MYGEGGKKHILFTTLHKRHIKTNLAIKEIIRIFTHRN